MRVDVVLTVPVVAWQTRGHLKCGGERRIYGHSLTFSFYAIDPHFTLANFFELRPVDQIRCYVDHFAVLDRLTLRLVYFEMALILTEGIAIPFWTANVRVGRFHVLGDGGLTSEQGWLVLVELICDYLSATEVTIIIFHTVAVNSWLWHWWGHHCRVLVGDNHIASSLISYHF